MRTRTAYTNTRQLTQEGKGDGRCGRNVRAERQYGGGRREQGVDSRVTPSSIGRVRNES